jgi:uridine kinase
MHNKHDVLAHIAAHAAKSPLLVGIDGCSAAGKSTLARFIQTHLPDVTIVHGDDFYRVMNEGARAALDAAGGYEFYYDWQCLENEVLGPLSRGQPACYQCYDWNTGCLGEQVEVQAQGIILVEGVYTTRPELRAYYDIAIFVETSFSSRMRRQGERTDPPDWVARWEAAEAYYLDHYQPQTHANLIIVGESPN